jgi:hypothetical protein
MAPLTLPVQNATRAAIMAYVICLTPQTLCRRMGAGRSEIMGRIKNRPGGGDARDGAAYGNALCRRMPELLGITWPPGP